MHKKFYDKLTRNLQFFFKIQVMHITPLPPSEKKLSACLIPYFCSQYLQKHLQHFELRYILQKKTCIPRVIKLGN